MARAFIFGEGQQYKTPEDLAKARAVANAMLLNRETPKDLGSGLNAIAQALMYRSMMGDIRTSEKAGQESAAATFNRAMGGPGAFPPAPGSTKVANALAGKPTADNPNLPSRLDFRDTEVAGDFTPQQRALINTIYGPESRGKYNVMYGGGTFDDMSDHPRQYHRIMSGPNKGKLSSAAGAGQFLARTWDDQARKLGLKDFSPQSQDKATWNLAREAYANKTGGNLDEALASGDPQILAGVGRALSSTWTSLPGGIEQGIGSNAFVSAYNSNLGGGAPASAVAAVNRMAGGQPVQVASLDPSIGLPGADPYSLIPATDTRGEDQRAKFRQWNSDPAGNNAANMAGIDPALAGVVKRAQEIAGTKFVIGAGRRTPEQQRNAVKWGWSKTMDSDHLGGGAADLWPVNDQGQVYFDPQKQAQIAAAMKQAAQELGVDIEAGADWKGFKDMPHFGMIGQTPLDNAPIPTQRPDHGAQVASLDLSIGLPQQTQPVAPPLPAPRAIADRPIAAAAASQPPQGTQVAQAGPDLSRLPVTAGGNAGVYQQGQGATLPQLYQALQDPWLNETQRAIIGGQIERLQQEADPLRQLQLRKLEREIASPQKNWQKLDENTLFDPESGEIKRIGAGDQVTGPFKGNSVEAQALNGLVTSGQLTTQQAYQLAAGKPVTDPSTGALIFMTPQGIFGQPAQGGPAQPITPTPSPSGTTPAPAPAPAPVPSGQQESTQRPGVIQLTDPKATKPTEAQRNRVSSVNQAFQTINDELDRYAALVKKNGIEVMPGEGKDNLNAVRQGIMLQMKELFNLGVLNGPDLSLMERMIYDPVVDVTKEGGLVNLVPQLWTGAFGGADERARNSVSELKRMLRNIKESAAQSIGAPSQPPPATLPDGVVDWRDYFGKGAQ